MFRLTLSVKMSLGLFDRSPHGLEKILKVNFLHWHNFPTQPTGTSVGFMSAVEVCALSRVNSLHMYRCGCGSTYLRGWYRHDGSYCVCTLYVYCVCAVCVP